MIRRPLLLRMYDAATMQRWNDKLRPVEFVELDKQAHKAIIAYVLGRFEIDAGNVIDWTSIIEGCLFEFFQRLTITDLKPDLLYSIKGNKKKYLQFNRWVVNQMENYVLPLNEELFLRFKNYLLSDEEDLNKKIINAAHYYATRWEFDIIARANPNGFEIRDIRKTIDADLERYGDLHGMQQLALHEKYRHFLDLCGELRFQIRWSHMHREPKTSVLGHMLIVAILSYFFSLDIGACPLRQYNNYYTGLFHDLPEVLTKDVVAHVKQSTKGIDSLIKQFESREVNRRIIPLIPPAWHDSIRMYTEDEFSDIVTVSGQVRQSDTEEISKKYNHDRNNPRDGSIVEACDKLAAFMEAYLASKNGIQNEQFDIAMMSIRTQYMNKRIGNTRLWDVYADF